MAKIFTTADAGVAPCLSTGAGVKKFFDVSLKDNFKLKKVAVCHKPVKARYKKDDTSSRNTG